MGMYSITGWSGGGRRPLTYNLKAGQFRGMGRVNVIPSQTTIINNNIIGGGYQTNHCCDNSTPKWMNWMMGIGIGSTLLGGILNMFGIGGGGGTVEGAGGKEEPQTRTVKEKETTDPTQSKEYKELKAQHEKDLAEIAKLKEQAKAFQEAQQATRKVEQPQVEPKEPEQPDYSFIKNGAAMVCRDASGRTQNIAGTLSNVQTDANGVPQSFTLTDGTSGNKYQYEVRVGSDGSLTYECISKNGQTTIGAPTYTLENGELVNKEGQNGFGQGIKTQSTPTQTVTTPTQTTPASQNEIKTLPDGTMVSDDFTAVTPYEHSDGKYYSKEEAITPWGKYAQQSTQATTQKANTANNSKIELKYEYKDHRGHFYANGKEITQQEYMKLKNGQEANQTTNTQTTSQNSELNSIKTALENSQAFKNAGGSDVKITQNSNGTYTATFKIAGGTRTISGEALQKFIES